MPDIQHLIELLKSDNPKKRYEACEELRVSQQPLPQEAIDALRFATNDPKPDIAEAAQRALALHTSRAEKKEQHLEQAESSTSTVKNWTLISFLIGPLISALFLVSWGFGIFSSIIFGVPGIMLSLIGGYIGRRDMSTVVVGAGVGSLLWFLFILLTCLVCQ